MKKFTLKRAVVFGMLAVLAATFTGSATPAIADARVSHKITITSENLDEILFVNNSDTINAMNAILRAKDQVNIARAALLPSLSINVLLAISNPPMFMVNTITCLVPFLFPSNWFDLRAAQAAGGATTMAFHITRLNVYSQAYALSESVSSDMRVLAAVEAHYARLEQYVKDLQLQADLGTLAQFEVERAKLDLGKYAMDLSNTRQLIAEEREAIRKLFGFTISQEFDFAMSEVGASKFESNLPGEFELNDIVSRAPERIQIDYLIAQARAQVKSAQWAWLGGCQGQSGGFNLGGSNGSGGVFSVGTGFSINLGFGIYPKIQLARHNLQDVMHRQDELKLELARILKVSVADITEIKIRMGLAEQNLAIAERMLAQQAELLPLGRVSVREMLDTYSSISQSRTAALTNHMALDGHRITLKRVTLEGGFLKVYRKSRAKLELGEE